jgi:hypothetical protein
MSWREHNNREPRFSIEKSGYGWFNLNYRVVDVNGYIYNNKLSKEDAQKLAQDLNITYNEGFIQGGAAERLALAKKKEKA